jgi:hypothetical protein
VSALWPLAVVSPGIRACRLCSRVRPSNMVAARIGPSAWHRWARGKNSSAVLGSVASSGVLCRSAPGHQQPEIITMSASAPLASRAGLADRELYDWFRTKRTRAMPANQWLRRTHMKPSPASHYIRHAASRASRLVFAEPNEPRKAGVINTLLERAWDVSRCSHARRKRGRGSSPL